jgi:hypothetical protein
MHLQDTLNCANGPCPFMAQSWLTIAIASDELAERLTCFVLQQVRIQPWLSGFRRRSCRLGNVLYHPPHGSVILMSYQFEHAMPVISLLNTLPRVQASSDKLLQVSLQSQLPAMGCSPHIAHLGPRSMRRCVRSRLPQVTSAAQVALEAENTTPQTTFERYQKRAGPNDAKSPARSQ